MVGSKLLEPETEDANNHVTEASNARDISQFWIGVSDLQKESEFRYDSNGQKITWENWDNGQPNDYGSLGFFSGNSGTHGCKI